MDGQDCERILMAYLHEHLKHIGIRSLNCVVRQMTGIDHYEFVVTNMPEDTKLITEIHYALTAFHNAYDFEYVIDRITLIGRYMYYTYSMCIEL